MKTYIDFSVVTTSGEAIGNVEGMIDWPVEPRIRDSISLMLSPGGRCIPQGHIFGGILEVEKRIIQPNTKDGGIAISLSDLVVDSRENAIAIMEYLEDSYGLFSNVYNDS